MTASDGRETVRRVLGMGRYSPSPRTGLQRIEGWPSGAVGVGDSPVVLFVARGPVGIGHVDNGHQADPGAPVLLGVLNRPDQVVALQVLGDAVPPVRRVGPWV